MRKLDRLGWATGICLRAYGLRIGIRTNHPRVLDQLASRLPTGSETAKTPVVDRLYSLVSDNGATKSRVRRFHLVYANSQRIARNLALAEALDALESDLHRYLAETSKKKIFVHAGVVGWRGRAIVIPGRSFSGKSTLVLALVRAGATYYSDEYAVLDGRGRVHPFLKSLSIRSGTDGLPVKYAAQEIGGTPGHEPLPIGCVVVTRYKPGSQWRPRRLSHGQAMLALLASTVPARMRPHVVLKTLQKAVSRTETLRSRRGEADEVAASILSNRH